MSHKFDAIMDPIITTYGFYLDPSTLSKYFCSCGYAVLHDCPTPQRLDSLTRCIDEALLAPLQLGVADVQPVWQSYAVRRNPQAVMLPKRVLLCAARPRHQVIERQLTLVPQRRDPVVLLSVQVNDALALFFRQVSAGGLRLEGVLQLLGPRAVAKAKRRNFSDMALDRMRFRNLKAKHLACKYGVHILICTELLDHIALPGKPSQHTGLDLAAVTVDDVVPRRCPQRVLQRLLVLVTARQILEVNRVRVVHKFSVRYKPMTRPAVNDVINWDEHTFSSV